MHELENRTIAAIATAQAPSGIGIVRISGTSARAVADSIFRAKNGVRLSETSGYHMVYGTAVTLSGDRIDEALALVFCKPKSYTGEDVIEISSHGGICVLRRILAEAFLAGASPAQPGEFTKRAFLNGKLDLTQAEAVMQLISAKGEEAARAASAANSGALSRKITGIRERLQAEVAHLSAWADFPEEDVPEVSPISLAEALTFCEGELSVLLSRFDAGRVFRDGVRTVIVGRPNVGKSTLMNLLSGCDRSIVSEYAGTTRDVVEDTVFLAGIPLLLADTAGIRETEDPVEKIGVSRAKEKIESAQLVLAVFDSSCALDAEDLSLIRLLKNTPAIAVVNKSDLPPQMDSDTIASAFRYMVTISAVSGEGLAELEKAVANLLETEKIDPADGNLFTERQRQAALSARDAAAEALSALNDGMTLDAVTVSLEASVSALYELTGENAADQTIDEVFSRFCVGK